MLENLIIRPRPGSAADKKFPDRIHPAIIRLNPPDNHRMYVACTSLRASQGHIIRGRYPQQQFSLSCGLKWKYVEIFNKMLRSGGHFNKICTEVVDFGPLSCYPRLTAGPGTLARI